MYARRLLLSIAFYCSFTATLVSCTCHNQWNDSFKRTTSINDFVGLVKIISFDEYVDGSWSDDKDSIPYVMTVEIIQQYKGALNEETIKIYGDDGVMCRPYLSSFELGEHLLIAPSLLDPSDNSYAFFFCRTEYLSVDMETRTAIGNYSFWRKQISLDSVERNLNYGEWDVGIVVLLSLLLFFLIYRLVL